MLNPKLQALSQRHQSPLILCPSVAEAQALSSELRLTRARVFDLSSWTAQLCQGWQTELQLLTPFQSAALWYYCNNQLYPDIFAHTLGWRRLLADLEAWPLIQGWGLSLDSESWQLYPASRGFHQRTRCYQKLLAQGQLLDPSGALPSALRELELRPDWRPDSDAIIFAGFSHFDHKQRQLYRLLRQRGARVYVLAQPYQPQLERVALVACASEPQQWQLALRYRRQHPQLQILHANRRWSEEANPTSAGLPGLLRLLALATGDHSPSDFCNLLFASGLSPVSERLAVAQAERNLAEANRNYLSMASLVAGDYCSESPALHANLSRLSALAAGSERSLNLWLQALDRGLNLSSALQPRWRQVLAELSAFTRLARRRVSYQATVDLLRLWCCYHLDASVGDLRRSRTAGRASDGGVCWLLALEQIAASANSQLPAIPRALPALKPAAARRLLLQLVSTYDRLLVSTSGPAPAWVQALGLKPTTPAAFQPTQRSQPPSLDFAAAAPPYSRAEPEPRGLNRIVEGQQNCPFQSFSVNRLGLSAAAPSSNLQPDAMLRGQALHSVLEQLAQTRIGDRLQAEPTQLAELIRASLQPQLRLFPHCDSAWLEREQARMHSVLDALLALEAERPDYQIEQSEVVSDFELEGFSFQLRVDRVDRLANGKSLLLDYKTGAYLPSTNSLLPETFSHPQVGIYAVAQRHDGVALLQLNPRQLAYAGLGADHTKPASQAGDYREYNQHIWDEHLRAWRERITELLQEYLAGAAAVRPRGAQICRRCQLQPLCRVADLRANN